MSRIFTLSTLISRAQKAADKENDDHVTSAEWASYISSGYSELYDLLVESGLRFFEKTQTITASAAAAATGTLTAIAQASLVDGELFVISDGTTAYTFEFDSNSSVTTGNTAVNISGLTTNVQVRDAIIAAINGTAIGVTAAIVSAPSAVVALTNDTAGSAGNVTIYETVANATFTVSGMSGGHDADVYALPSDYYGTLAVDRRDGSATWTPLTEVMAQERNIGNGQTSASSTYYAIIGDTLKFYPSPTSAGVYRHTYVPQPTDYSSASTAIPIDVVVPGGEDLVIWSAARLGLAKEESDTSFADKQYLRAVEMVRDRAQRRAMLSPRRRIVTSDPEIDMGLDVSDWNVTSAP